MRPFSTVVSATATLLSHSIMFRQISARTSPLFAFPANTKVLPRRAFSSLTMAADTINQSKMIDTPTSRQPIPMIILAGFLGAGKTSTLKHLLENNQNVKIGTIVNDVAEVNIDAKLIRSVADQNADSKYGKESQKGVVELQNGCACCSLADELLSSVLQLVSSTTDATDVKTSRELDAIVVELSGVADPKAVRDNWEQAKLSGHPATKLADLQRTVTLIDAATFGTDWMTWDTAGDRPSWVEEGDHCAAIRQVPELLAEQVEAADLLLLNKIDLAGEDQVKVASGLVKGLNEDATVVEVEFGKVTAREFLGKLSILEGGEGIVSHPHDHAHEHHTHDHTAEMSCTDPNCTDMSHSHSEEIPHSHDHTSDSTACSDPSCTDHSHSHSHEHSSEGSISNPENKSGSTSTDQLGISSFVYKASMPFNTQRLLALLTRWPVPIKDSLDIGSLVVSDVAQDTESSDSKNPAFGGVLRSKGFCWMAPTKWTGSAGNDVWRHDTAMYWSHAGKHFAIKTAGKWWGVLTKEEMNQYFASNVDEYNRIMQEDWVSEEWGDRRQELVFIGANLDESEIRLALDECLCTADEMDLYRSSLRNYLDTRMSNEFSLFNVGQGDHMDQ